MPEFTTDDLRSVIRATVGVDDSVNLDGEIGDVPFRDLGYDSLAILEIANKIEKEYGVTVPDDMIVDLETPRQLIQYVNKTGAVRS
ncbi:acyl carrier protein [Nonomuraea sediminis]|uniref:acyl carrier protein n=1 Tax=Nonomuraea sediminis TaxID=2835864 RepID=UPI001BDCA61A|nr:acyl carrier protein [Nonomuraea sediminis]